MECVFQLWKIKICLLESWSPRRKTTLTCGQNPEISQLKYATEWDKHITGILDIETRTELYISQVHNLLRM